MEIFPRGFILGRSYGNFTKTFKVITKDEFGNQCQAILKLKHGMLKLANNLKHSDNLNFIVKKLYPANSKALLGYNFIVKKLYPKRALEFALFDMNYQMYFRNKDKKFCRNDLKCASFLGSIGEVVGLYVDTNEVNSLLLFIPKDLKFSKTQIKNLELLKEMIAEINMVETMLCEKDYKDNIHISKKQTLLLLDEILEKQKEEDAILKKVNKFILNK